MDSCGLFSVKESTFILTSVTKGPGIGDCWWNSENSHKNHWHWTFIVFTKLTSLLLSLVYCFSPALQVNICIKAINKRAIKCFVCTNRNGHNKCKLSAKIFLKCLNHLSLYNSKKTLFYHYFRPYQVPSVSNYANQVCDNNVSSLYYLPVTYIYIKKEHNNEKKFNHIP